MPNDEGCAVAVVGLGVMGANLARNFASRGHRVALFNRSPANTRELVANYPDAGFVGCESFESLVAALGRPRRVVLMVPAGPPVDDCLDSLDLLLEADDIIIDAGNSLYTDTDRRSLRAEQAPWRFVGMGVSGGSEGALKGPSIMPGGDPEAWTHLRPILESIAAVSDSGFSRDVDQQTVVTLGVEAVRRKLASVLGGSFVAGKVVVAADDIDVEVAVAVVVQKAYP